MGDRRCGGWRRRSSPWQVHRSATHCAFFVAGLSYDMHVVTGCAVASFDATAETPRSFVQTLQASGSCIQAAFEPSPPLVASLSLDLSAGATTAAAAAAAGGTTTAAAAGATTNAVAAGATTAAAAPLAAPATGAGADPALAPINTDGCPAAPKLPNPFVVQDKWWQLVRVDPPPPVRANSVGATRSSCVQFS